MDQNRLVLLGSVAGGGDPAAVCAMLDQRIACAVPFNIGGPQPEAPYPLPEDAEASFNYAGFGSWESTRNLWCSARDGFLPWVIVAGIAPRKLIYAHEFSWDQARDPVWKRLQTVYRWYGRCDDLAFAHGYGALRGQPSEASHCTHIGRPHRQMIHPAFARWFSLPEGHRHEYTNRLEADNLACRTPDGPWPPGPVPLGEALDHACGAMGQDAGGQPGLFGGSLSPAPLPGDGQLAIERPVEQILPGLSLQRVALQVEEGITLPAVLFVPNTPDERHPVVVLLARCGKQRMVRARATEVAELLRHSVAVCALDVRGTGATAPDNALGRESRITALSATEMMFGRTLLEARLQDVLVTLAWLRRHPKLDATRIGLWGDSLAQPIQGDHPAEAPHGVDDRPQIAEPLGGLLALGAAAINQDIAAVYVRWGLVSYRSAFRGFCVHIPHEDLVVGAVPAGDIVSIVHRLQAPVRFHRLVDAQDRLVSATTVLAAYQPGDRRAMPNLSVATDDTDSPAAWFLRFFGRLPP